MTLSSFAPVHTKSHTLTPTERLHYSDPNAREELGQVIPFRHYVWLVTKHWWRVLLFVLCSCIFAYAAATRITPVYESTAKLIIDLKSSSTVIGESAATSTSGSEADQLFNTQLQLIQSDAVMRPVAERFHLLPANGLRILPGGMTASEAPVYLPGLVVTHPASSFLINITYHSKNPVQAAALANAIAHSYISRQMEMRVHSSMEESSFMEDQLATLKAKMDNSATALAGYERQLGLINSDEKTSIVAARLMQLNTEYTDSQNDRIRKEADFKAFKLGSLAAIQVSTQASALSKMEDTVRVAEQKMEATKTIYGSSNAEYKLNASELAEVNRQYSNMKAEIGQRIAVEYENALAREHMLQASLLQTKGESDALNAHSLEYQELKRQAEANKTLYSELYRKVTEAGINGAFQGSAIRIADEARPQLNPSFPNKTIFVLLGFLFSFGISVIAVLLADAFDSSLRDPTQARRELEVDVLGVLPCVSNSEGLAPHNSADSSNLLVPKYINRWFCSKSFYEESIETLLSSLLSNRLHMPLYSVLVTSANPGEGKSSCVAHMASAYARQGYKTLLIDADLRRPTQQQLFSLDSGPSLTDAILHGISLQNVRRKVRDNTNLHVVTAGNSDQRLYASVSKTVNRLLFEGRSEYDIVFVDAPPLLCFAEPIQLASSVDGVLVVSLAGVTHRQAVLDLLATLRRVHGHQLGVVLNRVKDTMSPTYKPYYQYYKTNNYTLKAV